MPKAAKRSSFTSWLRKKAVAGLLYFADRSRSGRIDRWLYGKVTARESPSPGFVKQLAYRAESRTQADSERALWRKFLTRVQTARIARDTGHALTRLAALETQAAVADPTHAAGQLQEFWSYCDRTLSDTAREVMHKNFIQTIDALPTRTGYQTILDLLEPLIARAPENQSHYILALKKLRPVIQKQTEGWETAMAAWWDLISRYQTHLEEPTIEHIGTHFRALSRKAGAGTDPDAPRKISASLITHFPEDGRSLNQMAQVWENRKDWRSAANFWQLSAATTKPVTTSNGAWVAENAEEAMRRTNTTLKRLRLARQALAQELYAKGRYREFCELASRAVELLPEHRMMKKEPETLALLKTYVHHALKTDQTELPDPETYSDTPKRIVFCLDVLKVADHYTHSRILFAICRNLMALDPEIETHIVVTNERLTVSTPLLDPAYNLTRDNVIEEMARAALPEYYGTRLHVHFYRNFGLEGLVDTCKSILALKPDVILYGGGHIGLTSNESRAVRHCLYDFIPTAFMFIQVNNEVDEKLDMVIARGPHEILGAPPEDRVRIQPYPTITDETLVTDPVIDPAKAESQILLSAVAGVRMDLRMQAQKPEDLKCLFGILDENPGSVWHFVGSRDPQELAASIPLLKERVDAGQIVLHELLPYDVFTQMAENAALYLQLPGFTGGAGGAGIARRAGVPILTFENSDVSGRQPEETVFSEADVAAFVAKANSLLSDPEEWERIARLQIAHSQYLREQAPEGFYDCLAEASRTARSRMAPWSAPHTPKSSDEVRVVPATEHEENSMLEGRNARQVPKPNLAMGQNN